MNWPEVVLIFSILSVFVLFLLGLTFLSVLRDAIVGWQDYVKTLQGEERDE